MFFNVQKNNMSTLSKRIREARLRAGLSQEQLGIRAGLEPESASTRMNRYELGKRVPEFGLVERLAGELGLPAAYFYAVRDDEAELLRIFHGLSEEGRRKVIEIALQVL